ncbi:transglutaminase-like domain-containing protein [Microcella daejeonensis]|uniref:Transglutaminase-like domain-containing protein n=1 Tax=Microcella daejeonensis TaxID=2994971 RepID=A0A9E8MN05_9MICO|nr:transglutaminase-like domain-containing protein [Microcella daejeonensis]WAB81706.1 transglutaminase-like domain-containing protein [Microcella daejeonensis]
MSATLTPDAPAPASGRRSAAPAVVDPVFTRGALTDLGVVVALSIIAVLGFETAYGDENFLLVGLGGVAAGALGAAAAAALRLAALPAVLLGVLVYFLLGTPITMPELAILGVLPSASSLAGLAIGAVFGWNDVLTLATPVQAPYYIAALPYFAAWAVVLIAGLLVLRWLPRRRSVLRATVVVLMPTLLYVAGILLGTDEPYYAAIRGITFAVICLVWVGWRRARAEGVLDSPHPAYRRRRLGGAAAVVAGGVVIGIIAGAVLAPAPAERFVLREEIEPPFDPVEYPSPLAGFRQYTGTLAEEELFRVQGLQPGQRLRLAAMDSYDGQLWNVAGRAVAEEGSGTFQLVGTDLPEPPLAETGSASTLTISIGAYDDVWMPELGYTSELDLLDEGTAARADDLRYNPTTGSAILSSGLERGARYRVTGAEQSIPEDAALAEVPTAQVALPPVDDVPDVLTSRAVELAGQETSAIAQLRTIEQRLSSEGFYSNGLPTDAAPSRAGHGADRMVELFTRTPLIGDEEQFAAAFALMARHLGYPARVVMGFAPEVPEGADEVAVLGSDVTAWVEVPFEGVGWIPFFPTPDETDIPQDQVPLPQSEPQPQVRQPPRLETDEEDLLTAVELEESDPDDEEQGFVIPGWLIGIGGALLALLLLYSIPLGIAAALRARRRAARRRAEPDRAVAGAWQELTDRFAEHGVPVPDGGTRRTEGEAAAAALAARGAEESAAGGVATLAREVDGDVFGGRPIEPERVDDRWSRVDDGVAALAATLTPWQRQLARFRVTRRGARG